MAWVRYDDHFDTNPKVTGVVFEEPGALSLHLLANTWTAKQKWPGYVPAHQPATLLCDRELGARWAAALVRFGLWHERGSECADCAEDYAHLPDDTAGFVFHHAKEYRPPARDRLTPGTPPDLSEKRREAGRKGGRVSADRRKQGEPKQDQANQASASNGQAKPKQPAGRRKPDRPSPDEPPLFDESETPGPAETDVSCQASASSKPSNLLLAGVSPVPVPGTTSTSNEVEAGGAEPTVTQRAFGVARDWIRYRKDQGTPVVAKGKKVDPAVILRNLIEPFLEEGYTDIEVKRGLDAIGESIPSTSSLDRTLARLRREQQGSTPALPSSYEPRGTAPLANQQVVRESAEARKARGWLALPTGGVQ
ncbi:hypothetical protein MED01_002355 [Micromonospora sp. MED01]|uniref:hypothetical protein n=1 Tax=Micromonospora alfalfae TaxID=2911212 RepID=UPI001EE900BF|nr:hypothetical protein [Micromonospora alfalfae]MCG5464190.1 hypothetical protein [Micromonospora alfalfae]